MTVQPHVRLLSVVILAAAACAAGVSEPVHSLDADSASPVLTVSPTSATVLAGGTPRTFDATLVNTTATLSWTLSEAVGSVSPATGSSTTYTPPATLDAATVVTLTVSGAGRTARAHITVQPAGTPLLTVTPPTATVVASGAPQGFDAALANTTGTISWSLSEPLGSVSPTTGTHVTYTPPAALDATTVVTITASRGTLSDSARITVLPTPRLNVTPATATAVAGGPTRTFDATLISTTGTVSWSLTVPVGSISPTTGPSVTYTPPASIDATTVVTLVATKGTLTNRARITVQPAAAPTLSVTPAAATLTAGGAGQGFDAALANTTGTISWTLSAALGTVSPATGTHVTYTPPATLDAATVVTLTATKGPLSDHAVVTLLPATTPAAPHVVNHTNWDPAAIPLSYLDAVRGLGVVFQHKSVGTDITDGLKTLATQNAARYALNVVGFPYWWSDDTGGHDGSMPPASWFSTHHGLASSENGHSTESASKTTVFNQTIRGLPITGVTNDSHVSGEYGATVDVAMMKFCFEEIWSGTSSLTSGRETWDLYRPMMEGLIRDYPGVTFVWMTMPLPFVGSYNDAYDYAVPAYDFNTLLRAYIAANGGYLLDVADLEAYCSNGTLTRDSNNHPSLCPEWALGSNDPHLGAAGQLRVAKAWWSLMARIAGYAP